MKHTFISTIFSSMFCVLSQTADNPVHIIHHHHNHNDQVTNLYLTIDVATALNAVCDRAIQKAKPLLTRKTVSLMVMAPIALYWIVVERRLKQAIFLIENQSAWCNWKIGIQASHIGTIPYADLYRDFFIDLQTKYMLSGPSISVVQTAFLHDIRSEMSCLTHCKHYLAWINTLNMSRMFSKISLNTIEEKISRLHFVERLFIMQCMEKPATQSNI